MSPATYDSSWRDSGPIAIHMERAKRRSPGVDMAALVCICDLESAATIRLLGVARGAFWWHASFHCSFNIAGGCVGRRPALSARSFEQLGPFPLHHFHRLWKGSRPKSPPDPPPPHPPTSHTLQPAHPPPPLRGAMSIRSACMGHPELPGDWRVFRPF